MKLGKKAISIILDVIFLGIIVFAVYLLVVNNFISINENILYAVIILLIPMGFYMTYMSFAKEIDWNKLEDMADEEMIDNDITDNEVSDDRDNVDVDDDKVRDERIL